MNKHLHKNTLRFINNVNDFISLRLKKTIKVINDDRQSFIRNFYSYFSTNNINFFNITNSE